MAFLARCKCAPGEFRVDAGGEFVSKQAQDSFMQVCYRHQIHVHRVLSHEHQANGKVENSHYPLFRSAMAMIYAAQLPVEEPTRYWSYALRTASYAAQFVPQNSNDLTPHELLTGKRVRPKLRAFGARLVYRHRWTSGGTDAFISDQPTTMMESLY